MSSTVSRVSIAVVASAAMIGAAACRHAQKTAVAPAVVPAKTMAAAVPETKVTPPSQEFTAPPSDETADPAKETAIAEQKGWIRDAFFDFDSAAIRPDAGKNLETTAQWLRVHHRYHLEVEGHCDERGTEQYNLALGERRAWNAKEYLATLGIDPQSVKTISYGKDKPFAQGHDEQAWAQNRRAHVVLTSATQ